MNEEGIAEFEGYYGPIIIPEKLIQRIWFEKIQHVNGLRTCTGLPLQVEQSGVWNHYEGPDFRNVVLRIGEEVLHGDVEIHFHEQDWIRHGHSDDPRYQRVVLHVVLFPGPALSCSHSYIPPHKLVLLDCLDVDLESLAEQDYLEQWLRQPNGTHIPEGWASLTAAERRIRIIQHSRSRFYSQVARINRWVHKEGLIHACHRLALDILGIPGNRHPFQQLAWEIPLEKFPEYSVQALWESARPLWRTQGTRPNNHPYKRLEEYHRLATRNPQWPSALECFALPVCPEGSVDFSICGALQTFRKQFRLPVLSHQLQHALHWQEVGNGKWNTLAVNLLLPLFARNHPETVWPFWFAWACADRPDGFRQWLQQWEIHVRGQFPHCNGWDQGAIALFANSSS